MNKIIQDNGYQVNNNKAKAAADIIYTMAFGDSLDTISIKYGISNKDLMEYNHITDVYQIKPGYQIKIPCESVTLFRKYIVKDGDTLPKIAMKYDTTWQKIYQYNKEKIINHARKYGIIENFQNNIEKGLELIIP